jgi:hypothetical protein
LLQKHPTGFCLQRNQFALFSPWGEGYLILEFCSNATTPYFSLSTSQPQSSTGPYAIRRITTLLIQYLNTFSLPHSDLSAFHGFLCMWDAEERTQGLTMLGKPSTTKESQPSSRHFSTPGTSCTGLCWSYLLCLDFPGYPLSLLSQLLLVLRISLLITFESTTCTSLSQLPTLLFLTTAPPH